MKQWTYANLALSYKWPGTSDQARSWIRGNMAMSIDGYVSDAQGVSAGISNEPDRILFRTLRSTSDVILVGSGTAHAENYHPAKVRPELVELRKHSGQQAIPRIALVTHSCRLDPTLAVFSSAQAPLIFTVANAPEANIKQASNIADVHFVGEDEVQPYRIRETLEELGYERILTEGGPQFLSSLIGAGQLDELCLTISPIFMGPGLENPGKLLTAPSQMLATAAPSWQLQQTLTQDQVLFLRYTAR